MPDFSAVYPQLTNEVRAILERVQFPSPERLNELLEKSAGERLELCEIAELLEIGTTADDRGAFERLRAYAVSRWTRDSGNRLRYVAPIYVSSFCVDRCAYCNFAATRTATVRKRLRLDELRQEIDSVVSNGARVIELVYATDLEFTTAMLAEYVAATVGALKDFEGSGALLCTEYLTREDYRILREAGLNGIVQWDETLDEAAYRHWHDSSPHKREFRTRMDNHDRALSAGLEVATGVLFGLTDYRFDALLQIAKARHFQAEYGKSPFAFGSARLKPIGGHELRLKTSTSDRAWETTLMVYQMAVPEAGRWLQTRENFELNLRNLLDNDVFTYRCGDVTPGGYHQIANGQAIRRGQFGVNELLSREYVESELAARNFRIDYAWM